VGGLRQWQIFLIDASFNDDDGGLDLMTLSRQGDGPFGFQR
jgi:hypothetical protein